MLDTHTFPGQSYPLGATVYPDGVNFSLFSKSCEVLELLLFDDPAAKKPARVIRFDPNRNKTYYYWHIFVPGIGAGQLYGYRAYGPCAPELGHRFDGGKVLVDPYARAVSTENYHRRAAMRPGDNCAHAMKSVVVDPMAYDWQDDAPARLPYSSTVIYEMHVGGFTHHANSGVAADKRGTYAGLIEKIPYLKQLGITAVELLPVQQFDAQDAPPGLSNYWGYSPVAFFAPHNRYSSRSDPTGPVDEFRDMVKALHRAGIEVILDVVFNHTAEGGEDGPVLSFKGLENEAYYILDQNDMARYLDYSGCGNSIRANHSIVRRLILDCLQYWVKEMHVDGFRFDLASVMARDENGKPVENPPVLWSIESDPVLAGSKIIAEAWDAAGLYQVGSFIGHRWAEWNAQFRDDVRRVVKGDAGMVQKLAARIVGSPELYTQPDREPNRSINFITCHDGFTLNDLVSYNQKHNEANGENNRDGTDANYSWNCGVEGPTDDPKIEALRQRQIKNLLTLLFVSEGTPMMLMGDEVRRTQQGNNNAYCQDNEISWFDWSLPEKHGDLLQFVRKLITYTQSLEIFREERFWFAAREGEESHITWHGVRLGQPDWGENSHSLAFTLHHKQSGEHLHVMLNSYWQALPFELPPLLTGESWHRLIDTALPAPDDFCEPDAAPRIHEDVYRVPLRAVAVLVAKPAL